MLNNHEDKSHKQICNLILISKVYLICEKCKTANFVKLQKKVTVEMVKVIKIRTPIRLCRHIEHVCFGTTINQKAICHVR